MNRTVLASALALLVTACHHDRHAEGPLERAGRKVDHAAEKTGQALGKAAEKTGDALHKAGNKLKGDDAKPAPSSQPAP